MIRNKEGREVLPTGLYGITAEKFSNGRTNVEVVEQMIKGGIKIIQYREKRPAKSYDAILEECRQIRALTRAAGVTFIVNDYVDVAILVDADGVHVGQDDLPVGEVKKLLGRNKIIGLSTHSPQQAKDALLAGADYIGVGPIFATKTKDDVCDPVGFSYLDWVVENIALPFVAIGGIKLHNVDQIVQRGANIICLVTEIVGAPDIVARVHELNRTLAESRLHLNSVEP
ncbi:MAG: thiamine phosphate synthase [Desulfobulbaceae bacterium]|nr:thiamine phosphate synthase [Desulfobulbaceae bacterium]